MISGNFTQQQIDESKLLVFQKVDRDPAPQNKGLGSFTKGKTDEEKRQLRLHALDCTKEDIMNYAKKYIEPAMEKDKISRVVFGSQKSMEGVDSFESLEKEGWEIKNPVQDLVSEKFD